MGIETAIIGSSLLGAAGSAYGASVQNNAAKDSARAQQQSQQQALALQRDIYQDQRQLQQPYYQMGLQGMYGPSGLSNLLGITTPSGGGGQQQTLQAQPTGQPQNAFAQYASGSYGTQTPAEQTSDKWQGYLDANPDLMQHYSANNVANSPHLLGGGGKGADFDGNGTISPQEFGQYHYQTHGQNEGRSLGNAFTQQAAPAQTQPIKPNVVANGDGSYGAGADQGQLLPASNEPAAPTEAPTEGPMTQTLRQTPGYQFMLDESKRQLENSFASRGELLSGSAMDALNTRTLGLADQTYQQSVNNNFNLANLGMGAAAQLQGAGTNFGNSAGNAYANMGNAQAAGYYGRANAFNAGLQGVSDAAMGGLGAYGAYKGWGK